MFMHGLPEVAKQQHADRMASAAKERLARDAVRERRKLPKVVRAGIWYLGWYLPVPASLRRRFMAQMGED
jgi:hypothetical protein